MHWWKRGVLSILSLGWILISCGEQTKGIANNENTEQNKDDIAVVFLNIIKDFSEGNPTYVPSIRYLDTVVQELAFYDLGNDIDPLSIVVTGDSLQFFQGLIDTVSATFGKPNKFENYLVWLSAVNGKRRLEISFYPHPTKYWMLSCRLKSQE